MQILVLKNGVSLHEGFLTHYGDPHKDFKKKIYRCSGRLIHRLIHTKNQIWRIIKKEHVNAKIDVKE